MQHISIFDLDRTITRRGTWSPFLLFAARRLAPWRLVFVPALLAAMMGYKLGCFGRDRLKEIMHAAMIGRRIDAGQMQGLAELYAQQVMARNAYPQALVLIKAEQTAGREVIIATASYGFYVDALAKQLGVQHIIATGSQYDGRWLTHRIDGENCYGTAKRAMVEQYFAAHNMERGAERDAVHVRFYSDDLSDLPTFTLVNEPIATNPSRMLRRHALANGWAIVDWQH